MTDYYTRLSSKEVAYGTDPAAGEQSYRVLENTHKYRPEFNSVRTVESGVEVQRKEVVKELSSGTVKMHAVLDKKFGRWFAMVMGKDTYALENVAVGSHVMTFLPKIEGSTVVPSFTMHKGIQIQQRPFTGLFGKKLVIKYKNGELVEINVDTVSRKFGADASLGTLSDFSTQAYLSGAHITTQTLGGAAVKFEDFTIEVTGPFFEAHKGGSLNVDSGDMRPASVKFSSTLRFLAETQLEDFLTSTGRAIVIKFDSGVAIPSSSPSTNYSVQFDLFKLKYEDADIELNQQTRLLQIISGEIEQDSNGDLFKITLKDETTAAYV